MIRETLRTVMPDGVTLLTDVARPNDSASRPVPLLLVAALIETYVTPALLNLVL